MSYIQSASNTLRRVAILPALLMFAHVAHAQSGTYVGQAQNGNYRGRITLSIPAIDAAGRAQGRVTFSDGLLGNGSLDGTVVRGAVKLNGTVLANGISYRIELQGQIADAGLTGRYTLTPPSGPGQTGSFNSTRSGASAPTAGSTPATGTGATSSGNTIEPYQSKEAKVFTRDDFMPWKRPTPGGDRVPVDGLMGSWQLMVDGAAYVTTDGDKRTLHTSAGAAAGKLSLSSDGQYVYGSTRGRWHRTGNADYPIALERFDRFDEVGLGWDTRTAGGRKGGILIATGAEPLGGQRIP